MSMEHYRAAARAGKKDLQNRTLQKLPTQMPALDTILEHTDISGEVPLGLVDIPTELIIGTKPMDVLPPLPRILCQFWEKVRNLLPNGPRSAMHIYRKVSVSPLLLTNT